MREHIPFEEQLWGRIANTNPTQVQYKPSFGESIVTPGSGRIGRLPIQTQHEPNNKCNKVRSRSSPTGGAIRRPAKLADPLVYTHAGARAAPAFRFARANRYTGRGNSGAASGELAWNCYGSCSVGECDRAAACTRSTQRGRRALGLSASCNAGGLTVSSSTSPFARPVH